MRLGLPPSEVLQIQKDGRINRNGTIKKLDRCWHLGRMSDNLIRAAAYARGFLAGSFKFWEYLQQETTKCGFF